MWGLCRCKLTPVAGMGEAEPAGSGEAWRWGELARSLSYAGLDRKGLCRRPEQRHTPRVMPRPPQQWAREREKQKCRHVEQNRKKNLWWRHNVKSTDSQMNERRWRETMCSIARALAWGRGYRRDEIPGWGLAGAAAGTSESLGVIPLSRCLNISRGFTARWEMSEAASCTKKKSNGDKNDNGCHTLQTCRK